MNDAQEIEKYGLLKFELLEKGLMVSDEVWSLIAPTKKLPLRTRAGAAGGLDLVMPYDIHVNAPVNEAFSRLSPLSLTADSGSFYISREDEVLTRCDLQSSPGYYMQKTANGIPMSKIGQMCSGDRFCYGMTGPYCWFWKSERRCKYCSIGLNKDRDASRKQLNDLVEALQYAVSDPALPAKHVLIGGGTTEGEDMGAILAAETCRAIKDSFDLSCYVMIVAPLKNEYIRLLKDSGVDELGMNLEFFSDAAWEAYIPGKQRYIGKQRYLDALEYAVSLFGPINTRSLLVVGLEKPEYTIQGAELLASMGVMPILSPFRPLTGTNLENGHGFDYLTNWRVFREIHESISRFGIPTGPTCIACQNNILALPYPGGLYRHY